MLLFDHVDYEKFFNPLTCKNKRIYYECILRLIEKSKEVPVLYENEARDTLILYFRNLTYAVEEEGEGEITDAEISSSKSETENATAVLSYFRKCNWISERELGRNGDNIASVVPNCRKMIDAVERIFNRNHRAALTNHIFSVYDILKSAFIADHGRTLRPYSNILLPVIDNISDLKNELLILKDSIRSIMRIVMKITETNELGQFLVKDEMMEAFFHDYFFIKKDGLIPGYIDEIEKMLRKLTNTEVYVKMIQEYDSLHSVGEQRARDVLDGRIEGVREFISYYYVKEMDYIDKKINSYYNLYSTRMYMVLSNNINMQTCLNRLLLLIKDMDQEEKEIVLKDLSQYFTLQTHKYVGRKSIERRKKRKPNTKSGAIVDSILSAEDKERLTRELLYDHPDQYGVRQAASYFAQKIGQNDSMDAGRELIQTREDAMMVAACIIYSGSQEFPYEVEFLDGIIETDIATISNVRIKRKNE